MANSGQIIIGYAWQRSYFPTRSTGDVIFRKRPVSMDKPGNAAALDGQLQPTRFGKTEFFYIGDDRRKSFAFKRFLDDPERVALFWRIDENDAVWLDSKMF